MVLDEKSSLLAPLVLEVELPARTVSKEMFVLSHLIKLKAFCSVSGAPAL